MPNVKPSSILKLEKLMRSDNCDIGTLASKITNNNEIVNPNVVKVHVEEILKDLSDEKSFFSILKEMNIDAGEEAFEDSEESGEDDQDLSFEAKSASRSFTE